MAERTEKVKLIIQFDYMWMRGLIERECVIWTTINPHPKSGSAVNIRHINTTRGNHKSDSIMDFGTFTCEFSSV